MCFMDFLKKAHLFKGPNHHEICCHFKLSKLNYPSFSWLHKPEMSAQLGDFQGAVYKNLNLFGLNLIDHQTNRSNCDELRFIRIPFNFKISTSIFPILFAKSPQFPLHLELVLLPQHLGLDPPVADPNLRPW